MQIQKNESEKCQFLYYLLLMFSSFISIVTLKIPFNSWDIQLQFDIIMSGLRHWGYMVPRSPLSILNLPTLCFYTPLPSPPKHGKNKAPIFQGF